MRAPLQIILAATLALIVGCGSKDEENEKEDRSGNDSESSKKSLHAQTPGSEREAIIPLEPIGLIDQTLHREPAKDDWQGEIFNDLASAQLKALGKILLHPDAISADELSELVHTDFRPSSLLPDKLETVLEDDAFLVRRPSLSGEGTGTPKPILQATRELTKPFLGATGLRTEFKIFTVSLEPNGESVSDAYFQISGRTTPGILTLRAKWRCRWDWANQEEPPLLTSIAVSEFEETQGKAARLFADSTKAVFKDVEAFEAQHNRGMNHWAARLESRHGIGISGWHGLAVGDANGDGLEDLYVCEPGGLPNRLFIAKSDGTVFDASSLSGTDFRLQTQAALFLDLDNDADQDLVLATTLGVIFLENDGRGSFTVRASKLVPEAAPLALAAADYDLDGDLDLYAGCYSLRRSNLGEGGQLLGRPIPYHDANNGGRNVLFRNDRNWKFSDATLKLGLDQNNRRFTLAASWEDYDDDGDPDLYVANDYGRNNLFRNDRDANGDSRFIDVAKEAAVEDLSAGMSVSWADADGDGDRDLYVSNMWSSAGNRVAYQRNFQSGADPSARAEFQRHARGNSLFLNNGNGTFSDASVQAGVAMGRWAWGSTFADLNNDGREDIFVANGFISQPGDPGDL